MHLERCFFILIFFFILLLCFLLSFLQSKKAREKADKKKKGSIGAPMPGKVVGLRVKEGDKVDKGQPLVVLSAMKMETIVSAPFSGKIRKLATSLDEDLAGGDLLVEIEEASS